MTTDETKDKLEIKKMKANILNEVGESVGTYEEESNRQDRGKYEYYTCS
jgi:hypothetical protein